MDENRKLYKVVEAAKEILANGYDQGRRIKLRATLDALGKDKP
jgi:hypothetical protein